MFEFINRFFACEAILVENNHAKALKGKFPNWVLADLAELFTSREIPKGEIWINSQGHVSFSGTVPETIQQQIRNIVASR